jgi:hypothetical protein
MQVKHLLYAVTLRVKTKNQQSNYKKARHYRTFDKGLLPSPAAYYTQQIPGLKIKSERVKVNCCFHEDTNLSLLISMVQGHFKCFVCGTKGGDIISFHRQRYNFSFPEAVTELGGWRYE